MGVETIYGFAMHALERYPYVVHTGNAEDAIVVEWVFIADAAEVDRLCAFEIEAGYHVLELKRQEGAAGIFVFPHAGDHPRVSGGDWVEHVSNMTGQAG